MKAKNSKSKTTKKTSSTASKKSTVQIKDAEAVYKKNEIVCLNDIPNKFISSYSFSDCPLSSFADIHVFEQMKSFITKNALFYSFAGTNNIRCQIEQISFVGSPITKYPNYRLMVLLAFGTQLTKIDGKNVTSKEINLANNYISNKELVTFVKNGGIIRTANDFLPDELNKRLLQIKEIPEIVKISKIPNNLEFVPFYSKETLETEIKDKTNELAYTSFTAIEKATYDFQNDLRTIYSNLTDIFNRFEYLDFSQPVKHLFDRIEEQRHFLEDSIQKVKFIESPNTTLSGYLSVSEKLNTSLQNILINYNQTENNLKGFLELALDKYNAAKTEIAASELNEYSQDYLETLTNLCDILSNFVQKNNFSLDVAVSNIQHLQNIKESRRSPYIPIIHKIFGLVSEMSKISQHAETQKLYRKVVIMKKMPLYIHFEQINEQLAIIHSCEVSNSQVIDIISKIAKLCTIASNSKVYEHYTGYRKVQILVNKIEDCRNSLISKTFAFWKTNSSFIESLKTFNNISKKDESRWKESLNSSKEKIDQLTLFLENAKIHLDNKNTVTTYIIDRSYDNSLTVQHNTGLETMIDFTQKKIKNKEKRIEELKKLIEKHKSS
ncbi:hypothetical protein TRFO_30581 [Tritrichomonas foetus]|uniref:Uncharacterized protein n=1 Tax=Tritrichomonas foetus TaxID=1144522 RepID=A0A1J4JXW4_9EUKA|nr:hypothetical protein TRFO_30581 [Tritrichomonas foetus]|eukprot:OHT02380.1 hypothetical protein TRFO_30581 [Tritrichomonas foetus]